jgi:hypothetical protein
LRTIPTRSSKPHSHPKTLSEKLVDAIVRKREERNRCAEVVQRELKAQGVIVSLSSVQRTLKRKGLIKARSPWKRWHSTFPRPTAGKPGDLVQIDTIPSSQEEKENFTSTRSSISFPGSRTQKSCGVSTRTKV